MSQPDFLNPIYEAASEFEAIARQHGWSHAFIGGLAACVWGEPRATRDFDVCVLADYGSERYIVGPVLEHMALREPGAGDAALQSRLLRVVAKNGVPGDIAFGGLPFEESMLARTRKVTTSFGELTLASVEDLLVMKFFAGRPQDHVDIQRVLVRSRPKVDVRYVRRWLNELLIADGREYEMPRVEELLRDQPHR